MAATVIPGANGRSIRLIVRSCNTEPNTMEAEFVEKDGYVSSSRTIGTDEAETFPETHAAKLFLSGE